MWLTKSASFQSFNVDDMFVFDLFHNQMWEVRNDFMSIQCQKVFKIESKISPEY